MTDEEMERASSRYYDAPEMKNVDYRVVYATSTVRIIYTVVPCNIRVYVLQLRLAKDSLYKDFNDAFQYGYKNDTWVNVIDLADVLARKHLMLYEYAIRTVMARCDEPLRYGFTFDSGRLIVRMPQQG